MLTTHNIDIQAMLVWLTLPFYDFCGFRSVAVNTVYKLQFFTFIFVIRLDYATDGYKNNSIGLMIQTSMFMVLSLRLRRLYIRSKLCHSLAKKVMLFCFIHTDVKRQKSLNESWANRLNQSVAWIWHAGVSGNVLIDKNANRVNSYNVWDYAEGHDFYYNSMLVDLTQPPDKVSDLLSFISFTSDCVQKRRPKTVTCPKNNADPRQNSQFWVKK